MQSMLWLVGVACGDDYLLGVLLAVSLDPSQLPNAAEEDLVEDYGVVGAVVEPSHLAVVR